MAVNNPNPTTSVSENYSKYAQYFESSSNKTVLSIETFFTLLMAEMTNQDPLEPTSNTEFVSQLANFTALQNSSDSLYYNTVAYAASLAGKTVTVATPDGRDGLKVDTGVVTGVDISDNTNIEVIVNGKRYLLKNIMNVSDETSKASNVYSSGNDGAYAVSLIGKKVTLMAEVDGVTMVDEGIVNNIEVENGVFRVVVNGLSYTLDSVVRVYNTDSTANSSSSSTVTDPDDDDTEVEEDDEVTDNESGNTETSIMDDNEELKRLFS